MSLSTLTVHASAKTNLWLRVFGKRNDGFHEIETRMVNLSLFDQLELNLTSKEQVDFSCSDASLPTDESNLVIKAVRAMEGHTGMKFGLKIHLEKIIPTGAGLGGGSSDAAAVIKAINILGNLEIPTGVLARIGASIGSDVPFFIYDQPCDVSGRGEIVVPLDPTMCQRLPIVLLKPGFQISAAWAYQNLSVAQEFSFPETLPQICPWGTMVNDLERPVFMKFPILRLMKSWLLKQSEVHAALLSGSGSTMLAILRHFDGGEPLVHRAREYFGEETWTFCGYTT